jgi:hypothetical protein
MCRGTGGAVSEAHGEQRSHSVHQRSQRISTIWGSGMPQSHTFTSVGGAVFAAEVGGNRRVRAAGAPSGRPQAIGGSAKSALLLGGRPLRGPFSESPLTCGYILI